MAREIERVELAAKLEANAVTLVDAQGPGWYEREHLPGAIRGRLDDPESTLALLGDVNAEIVVYCSSATCSGSALAVQLLEARGYRNVRRYTAGKQDWLDAGLPVESETNTANDPPIACTLESSAMPERLEEWQAVLTHVTERTTATDGALRLELDDEVDSSDLARLAAAEQECCSFLSFVITLDARGVGLEVRAPREATEIVSALFGS